MRWNNFSCFFSYQAATDGKGVDVIVEMLANVNLQKDLEMLAQGGTVAVSLLFPSLFINISSH